MKIVYDLSYSQNDKFFSGLYEYGKRIFDELNKSSDLTIILQEGKKIDEWIKNEAQNIEYVHKKPFTRAYFKEISKIADKYDIAYFPYQVNKGKIYTKKCKLIFTIHDLAELVLASHNKINKQEQLYFKNDFKRFLRYSLKQILRITHIWKSILKINMRYNIKKAYKIITISEYTKMQIIKEFKCDIDKLNVCYSPLKPLKSESKSDLDYKDYYLFVSASRYTKNTYRALKALDILWDKGDNRKAIVTGRLPETVLNKIKHKDMIISLGYVSEEDLEYLYKNAYLFIFPSLAEGFGSPPLEAMKYGTKVASSNAMSLKELYNKALLFDPYDINDIADKISKADEISNDVMLNIYNEISTKQDKDLINLINIVKGE